VTTTKQDLPPWQRCSTAITARMAPQHAGHMNVLENSITSNNKQNA